MKYLVTGGAGFIGSAVAAQLVAAGHEVVVLDEFNSYYDVGLKEARVGEFLGGVTVVRQSLNDLAALQELCTTHDFAGVVHLAAQAGVRHSLAHPEEYIASNYVGTFHLLEAMRVANIKKLVYASTSSVYGEEATVPFKEDFAADRPVSVYAATKRAGEMLTYSYHHLHQFEVACLRFFTVYGPWGRPDMAPFLFTDKILRGEPITVFNHGKMRRDFTYIDDIVAGVVAALVRPTQYEVYNLGHGAPVELMDFIAAIEQAAGTTATIEYTTMQAGDVVQTYADIAKAERDLGYHPQVSVTAGVAQYVDWFRSYYGR